MKESKPVVYITMYKGTKLPQWYIGSTTEYKVLNKNYNGSVLSKRYKDIWQSERKENPQLFKTRILSYHSTQPEAIAEELRLQKMHKVILNNKYINLAYAKKNGCFGVSGKDHPNFNIPCPEAHKEAMRLKFKDVPLLESTKIKMRLNHADVSGENNPMFGSVMTEDHKNVFGRANKDVPLSTAHKIKISKNMPDRSGKLNPMWNVAHTKETLNTMRNNRDASKKNCPHCGLLVDVQNTKRWHGDKCKQKGKNII